MHKQLEQSKNYTCIEPQVVYSIAQFEFLMVRVSPVCCIRIHLQLPLSEACGCAAA